MVKGFMCNHSLLLVDCQVGGSFTIRRRRCVMTRDYHPADDPDWLPQSAIDALNTERSVITGETQEQTARRLLRENAPGATLAIIHIALYGSNERLRLDAGKYVLDRVLGRPGDDVGEGSKSPLEAALERMQEAAEVHANRGR
jgi:hypothetical protein